MRRSYLARFTRALKVRMNSKQIFEDIKKDINSVLESGQEIISAPVLLDYLKEKEKLLELSSEEAERQHMIQLERFKQEHDERIATYKTKHEVSVEMFRSVLTTGATAIKTSLLVNGASAIAILGFLSRVWSASIPAAVSRGLSFSLVLFGFGVLLSALATIAAYGTQHCFQYKQIVAAKITRMFAILFVFAAYGVFSLGILHSYLIFSQNL